jgi:hypothetical protein
LIHAIFHTTSIFLKSPHNLRLLIRTECTGGAPDRLMSPHP